MLRSQTIKIIGMEKGGGGVCGVLLLLAYLKLKIDAGIQDWGKFFKFLEASATTALLAITHKQDTQPGLSQGKVLIGAVNTQTHMYTYTQTCLYVQI